MKYEAYTASSCYENGKRRRNKTQSEILTSTPYKKKLEADKAAVNRKKIPKSVKKKSGKTIPRSRKEISVICSSSAVGEVLKAKKVTIKKNVKRLKVKTAGQDEMQKYENRKKQSKTPEEDWFCFYCQEESKRT
jgi:hypothetical protein